MTAPDDALAAIEARAAATAATLDLLRAEAREHGDDSYGYGICRVLSVLQRGVDPDVTSLLAALRSLRAHVASEPERTAAAVAGEREACAAACRDVASDAADDDPVSETADACAEAIDARAVRS